MKQRLVSLSTSPPTGTLIDKTVLFLCITTALFEGADNVSLGLAAPKLARELGLQPSQIGLALSASLFGLMLGAVWGGRLSDLIGRKRVLILSVGALGVFSLGTTLARDLGSLLGFRLLVGLALGAAFPLLIAIASEVSSSRRRATCIGLVYSGQPLGAAMLSLLVNLMGVGPNWRVIFYVGGSLPLLLVPILSVWLPETTAFREARHKVSVAISATPRACAVLFGHGRLAVTLLLWASCAFTLFVVYVLLNWLPSLMLAKGLIGPQTAMVSMTLNLGGALGVLVFGAVADRGLQLRAISGCCALLLSSLAALAVLGGYGMMLLFAGLAGFSMLGSQLVLYSLAADYYPVSSRGTGLGAMVSVGRIGAVGAPIAAGILLSMGYGATAVLYAAAVCAFVAAVLSIILLFNLERNRPVGV